MCVTMVYVIINSVLRCRDLSVWRISFLYCRMVSVVWFRLAQPSSCWTRGERSFTRCGAPSHGLTGYKASSHYTMLFHILQRLLLNRGGRWFNNPYCTDLIYIGQISFTLLNLLRRYKACSHCTLLLAICWFDLLWCGLWLFPTGFDFNCSVYDFIHTFISI